MNVLEFLSYIDDAKTHELLNNLKLLNWKINEIEEKLKSLTRLDIFALAKALDDVGLLSDLKEKKFIIVSEIERRLLQTTEGETEVNQDG